MYPTHNNYWSHGGGLSISGTNNSPAPLQVVMEDNIISRNETQLFGGGVYFYLKSKDTIDLRSGVFLENHSDYAGGAIDYSVQDQPTLVLLNALLTENTARAGGAIWACPTSRTMSYSTLGGAISGNHLDESPSATVYAPTGHDVRFEGYNPSIGGILANNDPTYHLLTVHERTYLGDKVNWYADNPNALYQPGALPLPPEEYTGRSSTIGLYSELESGADWVERHQQEARLFFYGNTAGRRGGAISTNSDITMGEASDVSLGVSKVWLDEEGAPLAEGIPTSVYITLYREDSMGGLYTLETVPLSAANGWPHVFSHLPSKGLVNGEILPFSYSVKEESLLPFFAVTYDTLETGGDADTEITLTNTKQALTSIPVTKVWADNNNAEGQRPQSVTVSLLADGADTGKALTLTQDNNWMGIFVELPVENAGQAIAYTVDEPLLPEFYTMAIAGTAANGFTVTNTYEKPPEPTISIPVTKVWAGSNNQDGARPQSVTIKLYADGVDTGKTLTLTSANSWKDTFDNLPVEAAGKAIVYTEKEAALPAFYTAAIAGTAADGFTITNTYKKPPAPVEPPEPTYPTLRVPMMADKVLKNGTLKGGEFSFQLKDRQGKVIAEATNAADGTVTFPERTFSREVSNWVYTINEVPGGNSRITYDNTVYTVKVTTTAVAGQLEATVKIEKDGKPHDGTITFINQAEVPPTGDSIYRMMGLLLGVSLLLMGGAYTLSRRRSSQG